MSTRIFRNFGRIGSDEKTASYCNAAIFFAQITTTKSAIHNIHFSFDSSASQRSDESVAVVVVTKNRARGDHLTKAFESRYFPELKKLRLLALKSAREAGLED